MDWIEALALGLVQGITEFLPVSSDGHLVFTHQVIARMAGKPSIGSEDVFFDVMLHLGTMAAVILYFRAVVATSIRGLLGSEDVPPAYRRTALIRTGVLVGVATLPLVPLKLFLMDRIEKTYESLTAAGIGFLITAGVLATTALWRNRGEGGKGPEETTYLDALLIGIAQMFAPLPGVSRSGMTVASGLGVGLSRAWAVGFSLLISVPAILGGAVIKLKDVNPATLSGDRVAQILAGAALAGLVGYGAIIWLVKIVRSGRVWYFSVYLVLIGIAAMIADASLPKPVPQATAPVAGEAYDAGKEATLDGAPRGGSPGPSAGQFEG